MQSPRASSRGLLVLAALAILVLGVGAFVVSTISAEREPSMGRLGRVDFRTSSRSPEAQQHFLRGVAALHSFWYPVALDEFRAATRIEPQFTMGYWGEAMAHNHPIWGEPQETEAARKVLARVQMTPELTPRERSYLNAVQVLYGEGERPARDQAYARAMEAIYRTYPDDLEAAAFYALALLGSVRHSDAGSLRTRMRAGAIAMDVYRREPDHPGAAHYILHAFDDPDHAILALPAARRYAQIAPEAFHALHMPSHIFLQLGMWPEAAASNGAAWKASDEWVKRRKLPISRRDYHSLHWLLYVYLQQGRARDAEPLLATMRESLAQFPRDDLRMQAFGAYIAALMPATYLVETEAWDAADEILPPEPGKTPGSGPAGAPYQAFAALARSPALFARGLAAAMRGSADALRSAEALRAIGKNSAAMSAMLGVDVPKILQIQAMEITTARQATGGDLDGAIGTMKEATALEESMPPPPGPPPLVKPSHELFGEILLRADRPAEAARQFARSLFRHPNRELSRRGAERAAAAGSKP